MRSQLVEETGGMANSDLKSWVRLDIDWLAHPKVRRAGLLGRALWIAGLLYSRRMDTDGDIPADVLDLLASEAGITHDQAGDAATKLLEVGLWDRTADGWHVHDYEHAQETRDEREERRASWADRQRARRTRIARNPFPPGRTVTRDSPVTHGGVFDPESESESESEVVLSSLSSSIGNAPARNDDDNDERVAALCQAIANERARQRITDRKIKDPERYQAKASQGALTDWAPRVAQLINQGMTDPQILAQLTQRAGRAKTPTVLDEALAIIEARTEGPA